MGAPRQVAMSPAMIDTATCIKLKDEKKISQGTEEQGTGSKRRLVPTDAVPTNFKVRLQIVSCYLITYVFLAEI